MRNMTEAVPAPAPKPVTPPPPPAAEKAPIKLPVALVVALVGAGLFIVGSILDFYDIGIPDVDSPALFDNMSGKVGLCLMLIAVLVVAVKKLQTIGVVAASLTLGAVLAPMIDTASGDVSADAGIGMYATLFGAAIVLLAVFMIPKKKASKK
jgi:hypothetical protein